MIDNIKTKINLARIGNPVHSKSLEDDFGLTGSEIRGIIRNMRRSGEPVASSNEGYYIAIGFDEIEPTIADLRSRAFSLLETAKALAGAFNVDLQGDLFG